MKQQTECKALFHLLGIAMLLVAGIALTGCSGGGDDDGGDSGGGGGGGCGGEQRYYCITSTFTPSGGGSAEISYSLADICSSDDNPDIGFACNPSVTGSQVSLSCSGTSSSGGCTAEWRYDISGTIDDQEIDLAGTAEVDVTGSCDPITDGRYDITIQGDRVAGQGAVCGPPDSHFFSLDLTGPGMDESLEAGTYSATCTGGQCGITFFQTVNPNYTYTLNFYFPEVISTPNDFDVTVEVTANDARISYQESSLSPMMQMNMNSASGTLTISGLAGGDIYGSFIINGTMEYLVGGSGTENRTLTGSFNIPINYVGMPRQEILSSITSSISRSLQVAAGGGGSRSSITGVR